MNTSIKHDEKGFTLVELAIVMIIIGLLITGVLKGQEMIASAQVTSTVSQIKGLDAAVNTFRDRYDALPGDLTVVGSTRLSGCVAGDICDTTTAATAGNNRINGDPGAAPAAANEGVVAFHQLAASDLIGGINVNVQPAGFTSDDLLESELPGAHYQLGYAANAGGLANVVGAAAVRTGHYLALFNAVGPQALGATANDVGLTPNEAARIDTKLDDGVSNTGSVLGGENAGGTCDDGAGVYAEATATDECGLYIRVLQ